VHARINYEAACTKVYIIIRIAEFNVNACSFLVEFILLIPPFKNDLYIHGID
jgi:hypothetical protein